MSAEELGFETSPEHDRAEITIAHAKKWQERFDNLTDFSEVDALRHQAVAELDSMYPYIFQAVHLRGNHLRQNLDEEVPESSAETWEYAPGTTGQHRGFAVIPADDKYGSSRYKVMQQIFIGCKKTMVKRTLERDFLFFEFFDLDSACLVSSEIDTIFYDQKGDDGTSDIVDQMTLLEKQSNALANLVRSQAFRKLDRDSQQEKLDRLVTQAEQEARLRRAQLIITAQHSYINVMDDIIRINLLDIGKDVIGGTCLGLESLACFALRSHAIRRRAELLDKYAGICLVVDPDEETRQAFRLSEDQVFYLPVVKGTDLLKIN